jgi:tight adherence protein B
MEEWFPIIIAATVAAFAWAAWTLAVGLFGKDKRKLANRLSAAGGGGGGSSSPSSPASILVAADAEGLPPFLAKLALARALNRQLVHAYPEASLVRFLAVSAGLAFLGFLFIAAWVDSLWVGAVAGLAGAYLPYLLLVGKKNKRQRTFAAQLPEALEFLQRILRAGHSLSTGLSMMGDELPQPLGGEFRRCYDQHSLGQPLEDALREMARRIESTDFAFFVTAVLIQRQTGGDLSQVLGNIGGMIRQRIRLQQYVKAKTAEGRFTGYILVGFPVLMFFVASGMNPDYKRNLLETSSGLKMLGVAAVLIVIGLITIRRITTVKV